VKLRARACLVRGRGLTLANLADRLAEVHGDRRLVEQAGDPPLTLTYREAADLVARWSGAVAAKVGPGERVVVALPNGAHFLLACLAVARAGAVPVPVNDRMRPDEVDHVVTDSGATVVLHDAADLEGAEPLPSPAVVDPGDVAALFYTSGTTGKPKGARLTHRALVGSLGAGALYPAGLRRDEAVLGLPIAHIMGFVALLALAATGVPAYFLPKFDAPAVLDAIERRRASVFVGVPSMYRLLLEAGAEDRDLSSVRVWASGADVMPPDLAKRFKAMGATATVAGRSIGQAAFVEGYGMVETGGGAAVRLSPPGFELPFADTLGFPLPGYRFKVVGEDGADLPRGAVGELLIRGPGVLEGYHGDEDATTRALTDDGWLRTGDLARRGPLGTVAFAGRAKDVVKVGGYSVFSVEVERALEEHPDVLEAAVVGLPDERMGEVPGAAVRLRPGAGTDPDALVAWAAERLASYKAPRRIVVVDELTRTGTGKVQKSELRELFVT
jgi:acyl-CoA synthetase (AMP-forming)/AMP-acid ligase II